MKRMLGRHPRGLLGWLAGYCAGGDTGKDSALLTDAEVVEKPAKEETIVENATPDYAAGLVSTQVGLQHPPQLPTCPLAPPTATVCAPFCSSGSPHHLPHVECVCVCG